MVSINLTRSTFHPEIPIWGFDGILVINVMFLADLGNLVSRCWCFNISNKCTCEDFLCYTNLGVQWLVSGKEVENITIQRVLANFFHTHSLPFLQTWLNLQVKLTQMCNVTIPINRKHKTQWSAKIHKISGHKCKYLLHRRNLRDFTVLLSSLG